MPQTFVFSTHAARGDVWPYLAIGRELKSRGHRAIIASSESYRATAEQNGLEFRAVRPDSPQGNDLEKLMHPISGTEWLFRRWLLPSLAHSVADLRDATQNADVLITHTTSLAGPIVAAMEAKNGLKWASSAVSPLALLQNDAVLPALPRAADFPALNRVLWSLLKRQFGMQLKEVQYFRTQNGIGRGENALWEDAHSSQLQLCLWDDEFALVEKNGVRKATGFCFLQEQQAMSSALQQFLMNGEPPLMFVAASFSNNETVQRESLAAARILQKRAVFLGFGGFSEGEKWMQLGFEALEPLLPRVCALVHQGGIGTLALGLRAGVPMLLCPRSHDQPDNARRAQKLGIASVLSPKKYRADQIAREISTLLEDGEIKSQRANWQEKLRINGAIRAADELEALL
ncbi:MAG TPA: glycosyltransferase [Abditibacterium sp.]|jgi:UDP:flavonoid glycosyltransferase YjiC (YdhE family)